MSDGRADLQRIGKLLNQHFGLVASTAVAGFITFRLLAVAQGSVETASVVLQTQGTTSVLFGSVLSLVPLLPLWAGHLWFMYIRYRRGRFPTEARTVMPLVLLLAPALFITPAAVVVLAGAPVLIATLVFMAMAMRQRRRVRLAQLSVASANLASHTSAREACEENQIDSEWLGPFIDELEHLTQELEADSLTGHMALPGQVADLKARLSDHALFGAHPLRPRIARILENLQLLANHASTEAQSRRAGIRASVITAAIAVLVAAAWSKEPWLPREEVLSHGHTTVGYVLSTDESELVVLQDTPRIAVRLPADSSRKFCVAKSPNWGHLNWIFELKKPVASWGRYAAYADCV